MVGFLGFLILAAGGGGLAIFLGVPPTWIGIYVVGLLVIGAISGFGSPSGGSGGGGGSGGKSGSNSGGKGKLGKAADAATGLMDGLDNSGSSSSRSRNRNNNRRRQNTGNVSLADDSEGRRVGSFGNPVNDDDSDNSIDNSDETTDEEYKNKEDKDSSMGERLDGFKSKASDFLGGDEETEKKELTTLGQVAEDLEREMEDLEKEEEIDKKTLQDVKELSAALRQLMEDEGELRKLLTKGGGLNMRNFQDRLPKLQSLASSIEEEGDAISNRFTQVRNDIQKQEQEGKKIQQEETKLAELENELEAEEDRHEEIMTNMEQLLEQNLLGDHPYN